MMANSFPPGAWALLIGDLAHDLRDFLAESPQTSPGELHEISFAAQEHFLDIERRFDDSDFMEGGYWEGTLLRDFIAGFTAATPAPKALVDRPVAPEISLWARRFALTPHLDRGIKFLSSGEFRKALLIRAIWLKAPVILMHEPFEGLDASSRKALGDWLDEQSSRAESERPTILYLTRNQESAPAYFNQVLGGSRGKWVLSQREGVSAGIPRAISGGAERLEAFDLPIEKHDSRSRSLIEMRGVCVHYGDRLVLDHLDLSVSAGQHTLILGPNGSGKTTLVNLITGDCPQVYANEVSLFGRRRGTGETIWEIKARLGHVSQALHLEYLRCGHTSLENVLVSGFHDSIGLYEEATLIQVNTARQWLAGLGFLDFTKTCFADLPYGDQRLLLVARAAIKTPELLILDEACQGLERSVRRRVLDFVDRLAASGETTVLSITHDPDEYLACTRQTLSLSPNGLGSPPPWRLTIGREPHGE